MVPPFLLYETRFLCKSGNRWIKFPSPLLSLHAALDLTPQDTIVHFQLTMLASEGAMHRCPPDNFHSVMRSMRQKIVWFPTELMDRCTPQMGILG